jgi:hypothetical protein
MIGGAIHFWNRYRNELVDVRLYDLTADKIVINKQPEWVEEDLRQTVVSQLSSPGNLLDVNLVRNTAHTLSENPWIENVNRIEKLASGLQVNLAYRYPVALVDFVQKNIQPVPVDRMGVVLDRKVLGNYPDDRLLRISVPRPDVTRPKQWDVWQDARILSAAKLCDFLRDQASDLQLYRIVTYELPVHDGKLTQPLEIWTKNGVKIVWGNALDQPTSGEASAQQKLQAIQQFVVEHGPLVNLDRQKKIDVRTGVAIPVNDPRTADNHSDFLEILK